MTDHRQPVPAPVPAETVDRARRHRVARLRGELRRQDCAALLLYSPVNLRYLFDYANMQAWTTREMTRYALLFLDGPAVMFEFRECHHLAREGAPMDALRPSIGYIYMGYGDGSVARAGAWADEIADLMRQHAPGGRLAIDRIDPTGLKALEARSVSWVDGQRVTEHARAIKNDAEIDLMRHSLRAVEAGMARMHRASEPGCTENELWAELVYETIRRGGDGPEARLLSSGPRTSPWYQEASQRVIAAGELISFDTDILGPYGYCADLSRSWTCGHTPMTPTQRTLYQRAVEQIEHNTTLLRPGLSFREFNERSWRIPERYLPYRYILALHGVGMAEEWPVVALHPDFGKPYGQVDGVFAEGMTVCVESLMAEAGSESVKLETQVLITRDGAVRLDEFPLEPT